MILTVFRNLAIFSVLIYSAPSHAEFLIIPPNMILAAQDEYSAGQEFDVAHKVIFHRKPVGRTIAYSLERDVELTVDGESYTIPASEILLRAAIFDQKGGAEEAPFAIFCSQSPKILGKEAISTAPRIQFCVRDTNADRYADDAYVKKLFNARKDGFSKSAPQAIPPNFLKVVEGAPLPLESEVRIQYSGKVGLFGNIAFDLQIVEQGVPLRFSNGRTVIAQKKLPADLDVFGAKFTVLSYNKDNKTIKLRWINGFPSKSYKTQIVTTYTYIPIFSPR